MRLATPTALRALRTGGADANVLLPYLGAVVLICAGRFLAQLDAVRRAHDGLPLWDPAKYGAAGARLADALSRFDLLGFVRDVSALSLWPPGFPLLESPFFLLFGPSEGTALTLLHLLFALAAAAAAWAGWTLRRNEDPAAGLIAGAAAAGLLLASPAMHLFSSLVMLEVPGALGLLVAIAVYAHACRADTPRAWRWAAGLTTALFFVKYNYGLLWLVPLAAGELLHSAGGPRTLWERALAWMRSGALRRASTWRMIAIVVLLVAQFLLKGKGVTVSGREIRVSPGNIVFGLYVLAALGLVVALFRQDGRQALRRHFEALRARGRAFLAFTAAPIGLWLLVPPHLKDLVQFLDNRNTGPSLASAEGILFYPRIFLFELSPHPSIGGAVLVLALASFALWARHGRARRTVLLALALQVAAVMVHPYKEPRFLVTVAPLLWLAAAFSLGDGLRALTERLLPRWRLALAAPLAVGILVAVAVRGIDRPRLEQKLRHWSVPATVRPVLDEVATQALESRGCVLVGAWNGFSPSLVEWHLRQRQRGLERERIPVEPQYLARSREPARILDRLAASSKIDRVLVLDLLGDGEAVRAFRGESGWLDDVRAGLEHDPRFQLATRRDFPESDYQLRVYKQQR